MEPRTCTRLLLSLLAFSGAPVLRCCEVRNASGDATVANCTDQSAREFLRSFNATAWKNSTGLSLDFSYNALVHDLYVEVLTRWTNERSDLATSHVQRYYRGDVEIQGALHEGLSHLTNLESFSLNLHATMLDRMLYGTYGVCGNPFPSMPKLRSLAFNFSGNPFEMPLSRTYDRRYEYEQVNFGNSQLGQKSPFTVADLFSASEVQEIRLDLSHTNIQFPVQVFSRPAVPERTWPLRSLVLDVSGTKISGPVLMFTGAVASETEQTTSRPPTTTRSIPFGRAHPTRTPSAQEQEWKERRKDLQITSPAARFAHLSHVDIKAADLRLGDANVRDLVVGLASLPALEALALDLSNNDISDLGLRDVYGASQRMRQLRSLTLNLRHNNFALATAEACLLDWRQWLQHVEVVTDESVPAYGGTVLAATTPEQASTATSTVAPPSASTEVTNTSSTSAIPSRAEQSPTASTSRQEVFVTKGTSSSSTRQDGMHFHPQLALLCLGCVMMGAGFVSAVWWMRTQNLQVFAGWIPDGSRDVQGPPSPHWTAAPGGPPDDHPKETVAQCHDSHPTHVVAGQGLSVPFAAESYVPIGP